MLLIKKKLWNCSTQLAHNLSTAARTVSRGETACKSWTFCKICMLFCIILLLQICFLRFVFFSLQFLCKSAIRFCLQSSPLSLAVCICLCISFCVNVCCQVTKILHKIHLYGFQHFQSNDSSQVFLPWCMLHSVTLAFILKVKHFLLCICYKKLCRQPMSPTRTAPQWSCCC